jgi:hypothetical protein
MKIIDFCINQRKGTANLGNNIRVTNGIDHSTKFTIANLYYYNKKLVDTKNFPLYLEFLITQLVPEYECYADDNIVRFRKIIAYVEHEIIYKKKKKYVKITSGMRIVDSQGTCSSSFHFKHIYQFIRCIKLLETFRNKQKQVSRILPDVLSNIVAFYV